MPLLHVNAGPDGPALHDGRSCGLQERLVPLLDGDGPVIMMVHGFKFAPGQGANCPHRQILSLRPDNPCWKVLSWPAALGFGSEKPRDGLAIGFGWNARGHIWRAYAEAQQSGHALAQLVTHIRRIAPHRPVHALAHSLGARVVLGALAHLNAGGLSRIILLSGAEFGTAAHAALDSPAGRAAEIVNVTSRENDLFDFLLERLIPPPRRGDTTLAQGLPRRPNTLTLQLDHLPTLDALARAGFRVAPPTARICHWSSYMRPGVFGLYRALLQADEAVPLAQLRTVLPGDPEPRWSRLINVPQVPVPLPAWRRASF